MNRAAFLWRVLAFGWVGQQATSGRLPSDTNGRWTKMRPRPELCPIDADYFNGCGPEPCAPGESRCPLGHCQKARVVKLQPLYEVPCMRYRVDGTLADDGLPCGVVGGPPFEQHICSTCGIVYVPVAKEKESR